MNYHFKVVEADEFTVNKLLVTKLDKGDVDE